MSSMRTTRRGFLGRTAAGIAAMGASGLLRDPVLAQEAEELEIRNQTEGMTYRQLGNTGVALSAMTIGKSPAPMIAAGLELGANLVHTAFHYGTVPDVARVAKDHRERMLIAVKNETIDPYLEAIGTDYVDFHFIAGGGPSVVADADGRVREAFEKEREAGKVRFLGVTIHDDDLVGTTAAAVESDTWDVIMAQYLPGLRRELDPLLARARERGIGVIAMKTLMNVRDPDQQCALMRATMASQRVDSIIKGQESLEDLKRWAAACASDPEPGDDALVGQAVAALGGSFCGNCGSCRGCPNGVAIAETLKCADYYATMGGGLAFAKAAYCDLGPDRQASSCQACGRCEGICPGGLSIRDRLQAAHTLLA